MDIAERLRDSCIGGDGCKCTLQEAADEIDRLQLMLKMAYCQKIRADAPNGLDCCDDYRDWLATLKTPNVTR